MGAVVDALASAARPYVDKAVAHVGEAVIAESKETFAKAFLNIGTTFERTNAGKMMLDDFKSKYTQIHDQALGKIIEANTLPAGMHGPTVSSQMMRSQAKNIAREQTFGRHDANIAAYVKAAHTQVLSETGSHEIASVHAQSLADHVAMLLHDTEDEHKVTKFTKKQGAVTRVVSKQEAEAAKLRGQAVQTTSISRVKKNIQLNKESHLLGLDTSAVWSAPKPVEHALTNYLSHTLAAGIAIPHLATPLNVVLGTPLKALTRSMSMMLTDYDGAQQLLKNSGVLTESMMRAIHDLEGFKNGHVTTITPGTPAYYLNKFTNAPGFSGLRKWTTVLAGVTSHHAAEDYAARWAESGGNNRLAELQLREVYKMDDVDLQQIINSKGKLTSSQAERVIYNGTDDKVFLHPEYNRSYYSGKNGMTRLGGMFHGYIASQGRLMVRELSRAARSGNLGYVANVATTLGVLFPTAGLFLSNMERVGRGDFDNIHPKKQLEDLTMQHGLSGFMTEYIEDIAHTGAFGVAAGYVQGATRNTLANAFIGPLGNMVGGDIQDLGKLALKGDVRDIGRDALQQLPIGNRANIGKFAANTLLPRKHKATEEEKEDRAMERGQIYDPEGAREAKEFNASMKE